MPSEIQGGGPESPSTLLTRAFRLVGRFPTFIDEMVVGTVKVADLSEAGPIPEIRRAAAYVTQPAVALERMYGRLELPAGVIGRVRQIYCRVSTANRTYMFIHFGTALPAPAGVVANKAYCDGRLRARGEAPAGVLVTDTQVAAMATPHFRIPMIDDEGSLSDVDFVFGRRDAIDFIEFAVGVVDLAVDLAIVWDEVFGG